MDASSGHPAPRKSGESVTWRRVPWTCTWGRFDRRALYDNRSGERCFWQCLWGGGPGRPLQKDDCEACPHWEPRRIETSTDT